MSDDIEFPLTEELRGKNIQKIMYYQDPSKVWVWYNNKPIVIVVDLSSMVKTAENYEMMMNGQVDSKTKEQLLLIISDNLTPYMFEFVNNGGVYGNGNNDGLTDKYADALDDANNKATPESEEDELIKAIPNRDYSGFVITTVKKEVKRDDVLIYQVFCTGLSTYTFAPLNLAILAPTSEGKSYVTMKVMKYFPKEDVWLIGGMSTKVLVRQKGILINSKGESIQKQIDELKEELRNMTTATCRLMFEAPDVKKDREENNPNMKLNEFVEQKRTEAERKLDVMMEGASKLIDLTGKILVFLEPPHHELWNLIKPILSHDEVEIRYDYVATDDGIETKNVIVRGWPAVIFCSAKDESQWDIWPEIQSRFLITSPNMNPEKVHDGNLLIAQRKSLPNWIQQQIIVSDKDRELARQCVLYIKNWINRLALANGLDYDHSNAVWIPYFTILANALKSDVGTDQRATDRIFSLLNIIPLIKVHHRQSLISRNERLIIAELEDLSKTLHITQNMSGIPTHKVKFYKENCLPLYESKTEVDSNKDGTKFEDRKGFTTAQLRDYYKLKTGKVISTDNLKKQFLNELLNNGFIDEQDSIVNAKQKIFFPIIDTTKSISFISNLGQFDEDLQHDRIIPSKYYKKTPENWLELEISTINSYRMDQDNEGHNFQLIDKDDDEISVADFIKKYEEHVKLNQYFVEEKKGAYYLQPIRYTFQAEYSNNYNNNSKDLEDSQDIEEKNMEVSRMESNSMTKISNQTLAGQGTLDQQGEGDLVQDD